MDDDCDDTKEWDDDKVMNNSTNSTTIGDNSTFIGDNSTDSEVAGVVGLGSSGAQNELLKNSGSSPVSFAIGGVLTLASLFLGLSSI
jgi:hypothetical protein